MSNKPWACLIWFYVSYLEVLKADIDLWIHALSN